MGTQYLTKTMPGVHLSMRSTLGLQPRLCSNGPCPDEMTSSKEVFQFLPVIGDFECGCL